MNSEEHESMAPIARFVPSQELDLAEDISGNQAALFRRLEIEDRAFAEREARELQPHQKLSVMYLGALYVLRHSKNQYRISQASHALRELIEKLLRRHASFTSATPNFQDLKDAFCRAYSRLEGCKEQQEQLEALQGFFDVAQGVYSSNENQAKTKKEKAQIVFETHKPAGSVIPEPLLKHKVKELINIHDQYFLQITHGKRTSYEEFFGYLNEFEKCLLGMFNLRYGEEIDDLIKEVEQGGGYA